MECWALCVHHADGYFCRFCLRLRYIEDESNMIVFEVDSLFSDFGRFVIVGFFVDPPAVGPVFPVEISQVIAMKGAGQKTSGQQDEGNGRRDEPAFCNERSHDGTNPLRLSFILSFRPFRRKLNPFFPKHWMQIGHLLQQSCAHCLLLPGPHGNIFDLLFQSAYDGRGLFLLAFLAPRGFRNRRTRTDILCSRKRRLRNTCIKANRSFADPSVNESEHDS